MMLGVAVAGVMSWFVLVPLPRHYREQAEYHKLSVWMAEQALMRDREFEARGGRALLSAYHSAMKLKYERASRRPWIPIWFDPPEPR
jgi:hypothetical protein